MRSPLFRQTAITLILVAGIIFPALAQSGRQRPLPTSTPAPQTTRQIEAPPQRPSLKPLENYSTTPSAQQSSQDVGTIKLDTKLVTIPVSALDRGGKYIPHLTKNDFRIFEDGVEQEIASFATVETPFNVVLLLDTSPSTAFKLRDIQNAAIVFVNQLHANDRVMVVSFDKDIYIDSEFTSDRAQLRRAIYGTHTDNSTRLYDAVDLVITERLRRVDGRKAIVLFTDGVDTASKLATAHSTIARVEESGVLIYPIQYNTAGDLPSYGPGPGYGRGGRGGGYGRGPMRGPWPMPRPSGGSTKEEYKRASQYLRDLADHSGARLYQAKTLDNLVESFSLIADELRSQYSLSYYPTNTASDGSYRHIRVTVNQPNIVVHAREGYRAAGGAQTSETTTQSDHEAPTLRHSKQ